MCIRRNSYRMNAPYVDQAGSVILDRLRVVFQEALKKYPGKGNVKLSRLLTRFNLIFNSQDHHKDQFIEISNLLTDNKVLICATCEIDEGQLDDAIEQLHEQGSSHGVNENPKKEIGAGMVQRITTAIMQSLYAGQARV
jgi:hypothetical protein